MLEGYFMDEWTTREPFLNKLRDIGSSEYLVVFPMHDMAVIMNRCSPADGTIQSN